MPWLFLVAIIVLSKPIHHFSATAHRDGAHRRTWQTNRGTRQGDVDGDSHGTDRNELSDSTRTFEEDVERHGKEKTTSLQTPADSDGPLRSQYARDVVHRMVMARVVSGAASPSSHASEALPDNAEVERWVDRILRVSYDMASSHGRTSLDKNQEQIAEGSRVVALWKGGEKWYSGHIDYVNEDGTVDIQYDDGDYEWFVNPSAYVKREKSKRTGRSQTSVSSDADAIAGSSKHAFYKQLTAEFARHLKYIPKDGEVKFLRENDNDHLHAAALGRTAPTPSVLRYPQRHGEGMSAGLPSENALGQLRSRLESSMVNEVISLPTPELRSQILGLAEKFYSGCSSLANGKPSGGSQGYAVLSSSKHCHLGFARLHLLLLNSRNFNLRVPLSGAALRLSEKLSWSIEPEGKSKSWSRKGKEGKSRTDVEAYDKDMWSRMSPAEQLEQHRLQRELHLQSAADLGSREAQRILGLELIVPSREPPPNLVEFFSGSHAETSSRSEDFDFVPRRIVQEKVSQMEQLSQVQNSDSKSWYHRADAALFLSFAAAANEPHAQMVLGYQHYFHEDPTPSNWKPPSRARKNSASQEVGGEDAAEQSSNPRSANADPSSNFGHDGGSLFVKSCMRAVEFYSNAAATVVDHVERTGVHTVRSPISLQVEASDGIEGRNMRRFYGTAANKIGGKNDAELSDDANMLQRRSGIHDEIIQYYQYQAHNAATDTEAAAAERDLGEIYFYGLRHVERNAEKAYEHFSRAAKLGSKIAMGHLGNLFHNGNGIPANARKAFYWFSKGAGEAHTFGDEPTSRVQKGDGEGGKSVSRLAHRGLGLYYMFGLPVSVEKSMSAELYRETRDDDGHKSGAHSQLEYNVKHRLKFVDFVAARKHLQMAANAGDPKALVLLGKMRVLGLFVRPDAKKAHHLFKSAARSQDLRAKRILAHMSLSGVGCVSSCETAVKDFKKVAESGPWSQLMDEAHAHYHAGNIRLALHTYTNLALMGYSVAQSNAAWIIEQQLVKSGGRKLSQTPLVLLNQAANWLLATVSGNLGSSIGQSPPMGVVEGGKSDRSASLSKFTPQIHGERALYLYAQSASQGQDWARLKMGDLLFYGLAGGLPSNALSTESFYSTVAKLFTSFFSMGLTERETKAPSSRTEVETTSPDQHVSTLTPDYERAKFHYTQAYTLSRKSAHVQSKARFALGWMYERGFPDANMPRDIHLAKRMYDDASSLSRDASIPVQLALLRMRATEAWFTILDSIKDYFGVEETPPKAKSTRIKKKKKKLDKSMSGQKSKLKDSKGKVITEGSMIRARWKGGRQYFTGYIHGVNLDGTASVQYDDGDFESGVKSRHIERVAKRLHPVWVSKHKSAEPTETKGTENRRGIVSGSWLVQSLDQINLDVVMLMAIGVFAMIFALWMVVSLVPCAPWITATICVAAFSRVFFVLVYYTP